MILHSISSLSRMDVLLSDGFQLDFLRIELVSVLLQACLSTLVDMYGQAQSMSCLHFLSWPPP